MRSSSRTLLATTTVVFLALLTSLGPRTASADATHTDAAVWPLAPRPEVISGFDPPGQKWDAGHRGADLAGTTGQAVRAAKAGRITYAGRLAGRGVVVISHGDTRTTYLPVDASVRVGDHVTAGQRVGALQTFGSHCWPRTCLHWGLIRGEDYLNPLTLVGGGPVRLLPWYSYLTTLAAVTAVASSMTTPWVPFPTGPTRAGVPAGRPGAVGLW